MSLVSPPSLVLTETTVATLWAVVDRLIPPDEAWPGGTEAGVVDYLLRQLGPGGDLTASAAAYETGLTALNHCAETRAGVPFVQMTAAAQDDLLATFEKAEPSFFRLLTEQATEGFYISPIGLEMVGWKVTG